MNWGLASHPFGLICPLAGPADSTSTGRKNSGTEVGLPCLIQLYLFMYLLSLCWNEEKGALLDRFPLDKVCFANREFTASLQTLCELPASIWTGDRYSVAKCITTQLFSLTQIQTFSLFTLYCLCLSLLFLPPFSTALCHTAQSPVMQYDLFSYQLLALSTISSSLLRHTHTQRQRSLGIHLQSVGEKPVLRPTLKPRWLVGISSVGHLQE